MTGGRIPILYLAPWVDYGGSDTNTIDWFRWLDRSRFAASLITTQPSSNRRLSEVGPFASEIWALPELFEGSQFPQFIAEFIVSRGVEIVHVMNSRIGFDLLPDFRALKRPPKIVVQLHVEEPTRDGYVRYVTTRYGNLVDAYSVSSAHVSDAVVGYGIPRDRVTVIPTGIDTDLFCRDRVQPRSGLDENTVHLLFVARMVPQKDPMLMVEVARELSRRGLVFCIHVIGGGDLEQEVESLVADYGLQGRVVFESPTHELRPWYAATDILLMTSVFEGVPVIVYEALAMELPIVAPALPGIQELMHDTGGALVANRDRAAEYADALEPLIRDRELRRRTGEEGREHVMRRFSVQEMAAHHGELYEWLHASQVADPPEDVDMHPPQPPRFASRPARGTPRVSVLTPCFNHGRLLRECVESIRAQTYPDVELIVIDDGSTDAETESYMSELASDAGVQVVRMGSNQGPSAARNRGLTYALGRYILPVDADNLLLPDAIERLVAQLQGAGEHVGYIYQNCQYFGNREDYFEAPAYNPWVLTQQNYIDTCSLIDREVFDLGCCYGEDIVFGHEDWDFFLQLAGRGIHGEPARSKTLLYRKEGFTRSDLVEWTGSTFHGNLAARHPGLFPKYQADERASGWNVGLKARWAPALSLIAIAPLDVGAPAWEAVQARLATQQFRDFELLVVLNRDVADKQDGPVVRRLPKELGDDPAACLAHALEMSRARHILLTTRALPDLLSDPGSMERTIRLLERESEAPICFADVHDEQLHPFSLLSGDAPRLEAHSVAFSRSDASTGILPTQLDTGDPIGTVVRSMQIHRLPIEWRHLTAEWAPRLNPSGQFHDVVAVPGGPRSERAEAELRQAANPLLPGPIKPVFRWANILSWVPACTAPLVRHQRLGATEWMVTTSVVAPKGYYAEHYLGVVHLRALEGTERVMRDPGHGYVTVPRGNMPSSDEMDDSLGYVDQVAFALLEPLLVCRHAATHAPVLVCGEDDPLMGAVEWPHLAVLGYIDRLPINPHDVPTSGETKAWLHGLLRIVDPVARRHRVSFGRSSSDDRTWELGALLDRDPGKGIATWIDADGRLHTQDYSPTRHPYDVSRTLRWVGAPTSWRGFGRSRARARAVARRAIEAARHTLVRPGIATPVGRQQEVVAWMLPDPGPGRHPIFSATHPVTADQLVTRDPSEIRELGYGSEHLLGYALARAPETGSLARPRVGIAWGSRFGEALTFSNDPHRNTV
jgi:glycosyltransferase involved in cell wall biosynthesis